MSSWLEINKKLRSETRWKVVKEEAAARGRLFVFFFIFQNSRMITKGVKTMTQQEIDL